MDQQRHMVALDAQLFEGRRHVRQLGDARVVVAEHHEDGVVVPATRLGDLHQAADVEVQQAHGLVLGLDHRTELAHFRFRAVADLEAVVILGNGEGAVVAGGLDVGEERLVLRHRLQQQIGFLEQAEIGNAPHIHMRRLPEALLVQAHAVDALAYQGVHVRPAGVAADHVEALVVFQIIDQRVLVGNQRVARGGFLARHVRNAGDAGPDGTRGTHRRHVEVLEGPALLGQAVEVRRRIQRVAMVAHRAGAQGFEHDEHHVGLALGLDGVRLRALHAAQVEGLLVGRIDAEVLGQQRIAATHRLLVIGRKIDLGGVVEEQHRVQAQRGDLVVAGEERIAPAQRHRVFQVEVLEPAQQTEEQRHHHQRAAPYPRPALELARRARQGEALQMHQQDGQQHDADQPAEGDPHHRIGLPDHVGGDLRVLQEVEHRGVDAHAQVGVVAEVGDVHQHQHGQCQRQVHARQPAQPWQADQVPARQPGQQGQRQSQQDGQAQVETQADAQCFEHRRVAGQRAAVQTGETEEEHHPQDGEPQEEYCHDAEAVLQTAGLQPIHHFTSGCTLNHRPAWTGQKQQGPAQAEPWIARPSRPGAATR